MLDYLHVRVDEKMTKYRFIFNKKESLAVNFYWISLYKCRKKSRLFIIG